MEETIDMEIAGEIGEEIECGESVGVTLEQGWGDMEMEDLERMVVSIL